MRIFLVLLFSILVHFCYSQTTLFIGEGEYQCFGIRNDTLYGWGGGATGKGTNPMTLGLPVLCQFATGGQPKVRYVASGLHSAFCIVDSATNDVYGTGLNDACWQGACALTGTSNFVQIPRDNHGNPFNNVRNISANAYPGRIDTTSGVYFVKYDGTLWMIGSTRGGAGGDSTNGNTTGIDSLPTQVPFPAGVFIDTVVTYMSQMVIDSTGSVWTWGGHNIFGVFLGRSGSALVPHKITIPGGVRIKEIAGGEYTNYALGVNGHVYAWGFYSAFMGIGVPFSSSTQISTPTDITSQMNLHGHLVAHIVKIHTSSMAILDDGTVRTWGDNPEGSVGFGNMINFFTTTAPMQWDEGKGENVVDTLVNPLPCVTNATAIYGGGYYVLYNFVQCADGSLYAAGRNKNGVIPSGIVDGDPAGQIEAVYPDSWNDSVFRNVSNLWKQVNNSLTKSPWCSAHPTATFCSNYTDPGNASPTINAGSNFTTPSQPTSLAGTATPHSANIAYTKWTAPCGITFKNATDAFSLTPTITGLTPNVPVTISLEVRDSYSKVSTATVTVTLSSSCNCLIFSIPTKVR